MIRNFKLKFGRTPETIGAVIDTTPITVFVGPNNSGKSKVLAEIEQYCKTGNRDPNALILDDISFEGIASEIATIIIEKMRQPIHQGEALNAGHIMIGGKNGRIQVPYSQLIDYIQNPSNNIAAFCQWFLSYNTLILDGRNRINLVNQQAAGDMQMPSHSSFQVLLRDDAKRKEVRRIVYEAFNSYFVIDPTNLGQLRIRLSERPPVNDMEERGIHKEAVEFHSNAQLIDDASDGVKAFTGIIMELIAGDPQVVLIDEPEAFLHPSLATKLGYEISRAALNSKKRVFVSTHSPNFVMGCVQSNAPVNIVRLTYRGGNATSRVLSSSKILELMRNPLLRSTGVLSGLFYEFVIVTESDADRAFYQEINERLLRFKPEWGIPNCLFINAQNKQTIQTIIRPLRQLGIPAIGVVDIDVIKDGGSNWANLMSAANVPPIAVSPLSSLRVAVKQAMEDTGQDMKRNGGINILKDENKSAAEDLLEQMSNYGIFVVPNGELESWLSFLDVNGHGPTWLVEMFEKMGEISEHPDYILPTDDDVWAFIHKMKLWLFNSNRKGIPE